MLLFLASFLLTVGAYGVYAGWSKDRLFGPLSGRDAQLFGLAHVLVALWLAVAAFFRTYVAAASRLAGETRLITAANAAHRLALPRAAE